MLFYEKLDTLIKVMTILPVVATIIIVYIHKRNIRRLKPQMGDLVETGVGINGFVVHIKEEVVTIRSVNGMTFQVHMGDIVKIHIKGVGM